MSNLLRAVYWFDEALHAAVLAEGHKPLTRSQSLVMMNLTVGENRASELSKNLGISKQAVSNLLAGMERDGLILVVPDPQDGRARLVYASPQARAIRDIAKGILQKLEVALGQRIGHENVSQLRAILAKDWGAPFVPDVTQSKVRTLKAKKRGRTIKAKSGVKRAGRA